MGFERLYIKRKKAPPPEEDTTLMDSMEHTRSRLKQRKKVFGDREKVTLDKLTEFQKNFKSEKQSKVLSIATEEHGVDVELPAAWRIGDYLKDIEVIDVNDLLSHRLKFDHSKKDAMSRDMHALDDYIVVDPRLEKRKGVDGPIDDKKWTGQPNV